MRLFCNQLICAHVSHNKHTLEVIRPFAELEMFCLAEKVAYYLTERVAYYPSFGLSASRSARLGWDFFPSIS